MRKKQITSIPGKQSLKNWLYCLSFVYCILSASPLSTSPTDPPRPTQHSLYHTPGLDCGRCFISRQCSSGSTFDPRIHKPTCLSQHLPAGGFFHSQTSLQRFALTEASWRPRGIYNSTPRLQRPQIIYNFSLLECNRCSLFPTHSTGLNVTGIHCSLHLLV